MQRDQSGGHNDYAIRYHACSDFVVCVIGDINPGAAAASVSLNPANTFYAASTDRALGNLLLANGNLFWTETDATNPANATGEIKRKATSAADGDTPDTILTSQSQLDYRLFSDADFFGHSLFFALRGTGIYSIPLDADAIQRNFGADGMQVIQAIQDLADNNPLVATRTTYVRAFGRLNAGPNAPVAEARLIGTKNEAPLPGSPLQPLNGAIPMPNRGLGGIWDPTKLNDGWLFRLPASWTEPAPSTYRWRSIHAISRTTPIARTT